MSTNTIQILGGFPKADWSQNDPAKSDYIKNKPFYDDEKTIVQIDEKFIPNTIARVSDIQEQILDTITTKIDDLTIGGRNLLAKSDITVKHTNETTSYTAFNISAVSGYDLNLLIGKTITLSYYQHCPGARDTSLSDTTSWAENRFGMHLTIIWSDSTGTKSNVDKYLCTSFLMSETENARISETNVVAAPTGYDTISSIKLNINAYTKPASGNSATWILSHPKLEVGNMATDWLPAPEDMATVDHKHGAGDIGITYGTSLPSTGTEGQIFLLYS